MTALGKGSPTRSAFSDLSLSRTGVEAGVAPPASNEPVEKFEVGVKLSERLPRKAQGYRRWGRDL